MGEHVIYGARVGFEGTVATCRVLHLGRPTALLAAFGGMPQPVLRTGKRRCSVLAERVPTGEDSPMAIRAVLFDLDETLLVDDDAVDAALLRTTERVRSAGADPVALAASVRQHAQCMWRDAPTIEYCRRTGISSWEGLCADFTGDDSDSQALRAMVPGFRSRVWGSALTDVGLPSDRLTAELADAYVHERRREYTLYPDAQTTLEALHGRVGLGLVTNGPADLQREKIARTGLARWLDVIVISGEVGTGKPDPVVFHRAVDAIGVVPSEAVMVGDAPERDLAGARAAGMRAVWMNRHSRPVPSPAPDWVVRELSDLVGWLGIGERTFT